MWFIGVSSISRQVHFICSEAGISVAHISKNWATPNNKIKMNEKHQSPEEKYVIIERSTKPQKQNSVESEWQKMKHIQ